MIRLNKIMLSLVLAAFTALSAHALEAKVTAVEGKVEVQKGSSWVALKVGDTVQTGAVVSTGFKSSVEFSINGSTLSLGPLTRMTVEQLASNGAKDQTKVYIDSGRVNASVKSTESRKVDFKVSSPVATASVRGTSFSMGADGTVITTEGLVSKGPAESSSAQVQAEEGASDFVPADGESTATTPVSQVSATPGIPVFAGQTSTSDTVTGKANSPQEVQAQTAKDIGGSTATLSSKEGQSTAPVTAPAQDSSQNAKSSGRVRARILYFRGV